MIRLNYTRIPIMIVLLFIIGLIISAVSSSAADIPNYQFVKAYPETKDYEQVLEVVDLAFDQAGNAYVADNKYGAVIKYNATNNYVTHWDTGRMTAIAVDPFSNEVYVSLTNGNVQVFDDDGNLLHTFGESGTGDGQFNSISHITIDDLYIYISDENNHHVQIFNKSDQSFVVKLGGEGSGDGEFKRPTGLFADGNRHLYVADTGNSRIQLFHFDSLSTSWTYHSQFGTAGSNSDEFNWPTDLIVREISGSSEDLLIVYDTMLHRLSFIPVTGNDLSAVDPTEITIQSFNNTIFDRYVRANMAWNIAEEELYATNLRVIAKLSDVEDTSRWIGRSHDQFSNSDGFALDSLGNIYISDRIHHRILKYNAAGEFVRSWGSFGSAAGEFNNPRDIAIDSNNDVYVADVSNNRIQKFTSDGTFIREWGEFGNTDGNFVSISSLAVDENDFVYVGSSRVVQKFNKDGTHVMTIGNRQCNFPDEPLCSEAGNLNTPSGIAFDSSGNIYVSDLNEHHINKFRADGSYITRWGVEGSDSGQFKYPSAIAVDDMNRIYVVDRSNARIQIFKNDGSYVFEYGSVHQISMPAEITFDSTGKLYVLDNYMAELKLFEEKPGGPISDLTATAGSLTVDLSFTAPIGASKVEVKQREYGTLTWSDAMTQWTITQTSTEATVLGLTEDTEYEFYLEVTGGPYAGNSNVVRVKTFGPPTPIDDLVAIGGDREVTLTFSPITGATSIEVNIWLPGASAWTDATLAAPITDGATSATVIGLDDDTLYSFFIAVTGGPRAGVSNRVDVRTNPAPIPPSVPIADLAATGGDREVKLTFSAPVGATSITVKHRVYGTSTWLDATTTVPIAESSTEATVTGLMDDTTYEFYLEVIGGAHEGDSNVVTATTNATSTPPTPTPIPIDDLSATGGDREVKLTFSAPTGASSVKVKHRISGESTWLDASTSEPITESSTEATVTGLEDDTTYELYLEVIGGTRAGDSNIVTATTNAKSSSGGSSGRSSRGGGSSRSIEQSSQQNSTDLKSLSVNAGSLKPAFRPSTLNYSLLLEHGVEEIEISAIAEDEKTTIVLKNTNQEIDPSITVPIPVGRTIYEIVVQAQDGSEQTYTLAVSRQPKLELPPPINFTDISGHWAEDTIKQAIATGLVNGYPDGTFKPNRGTSRAEFIVVLAKKLGWDPIELSPQTFRDHDEIPLWAQGYIAKAVQEGIVSGYSDGTFLANQTITRAEAIAMIMRAKGVHPEEQVESLFADDEQIPTWARGYVYAAVKLGIISGRDANRFEPHAPLTRAECIAMLLH